MGETFPSFHATKRERLRSKFIDSDVLMFGRFNQAVIDKNVSMFNSFLEFITTHAVIKDNPLVNTFLSQRVTYILPHCVTREEAKGTECKE